MGPEVKNEEVTEETPTEETPTEETPTEETPTEETPAEESASDEDEGEKKNSVVVSYRGLTREYSHEIHGDNYRELAEQFAENVEGEVE